MVRAVTHRRDTGPSQTGRCSAMAVRGRSGGVDSRPPADRDREAALARIVAAIDVYLYTNEHLPDGSRRSVYSGPNRERLMGGEVPPSADIAWRPSGCTR